MRPHRASRTREQAPRNLARHCDEHRRLPRSRLNHDLQAGASFGLKLIWAVVLGTICIIFLLEMAGRFAAVSHHTISDAIRERFGFNFFIWPLLATLLVNFLVLSAEIGGVAIAAELATGISFQWWALPVA